MKSKKINLDNPLYIKVEGEGMCDIGTVSIQQKDDFEEDKYHQIRFKYEEIPELIKALQSKIPEINEKNFDKWDKDELNRVA